MIPKEKAFELYNKYEELGKDFTKGVSMKEFAKQCALIAVDNLMDALRFLPYGLQYLQQIDYLEEVKQEIEKL